MHKDERPESDELLLKNGRSKKRHRFIRPGGGRAPAARGGAMRAPVKDGVASPEPAVEPEGEDPFEEPTARAAPGGLGQEAAHVAFRWGGQAGTVGSFLTDEEGIEPSGARACSAALAEEHELMERLGRAAARAASSTEAITLIVAATPLALRLTPQLYRALWPVLPALLQGAVGVTKFLYQRSAARPLIRRVPEIMRRTTERLADQVARGRAPTQRLAMTILAEQTRAVLDHYTSKQQAAHPVGRSRSRGGTRTDRKKGEQRSNGYHD